MDQRRRRRPKADILGVAMREPGRGTAPLVVLCLAAAAAPASPAPIFLVREQGELTKEHTLHVANEAMDAGDDGGASIHPDVLKDGASLTGLTLCTHQAS